MTVTDTQNEKLHEQVYYTTCRVRANDAGGSGVCIFSQDEGGRAHTFVLTNHHVVQNSITIEKKWDPTLKREYPQEESDSVDVEFFSYNNYSKAVGSNTYQAEIVAWDDLERRDIALLKLREREDVMDHVATLLPYDERDQIFTGDKVYAAGAGLGHPVFQTPGEVTNAYYELGSQVYIGTNAPITFGNSGGGLYKEGSDGNYYLIGLPARVSLQGWGDVANHIGFAVPIAVIYEFLEDNKMEALWSDEYTVEESEKRLAVMRRGEKEALMGSDE